jgi:hypothetical protein
LFETLIDHVRMVDPALRTGAMFGCPAAYVGRRMAFCVYGDAVGAKLPQADAARLIEAGTAESFRPYGKPAMKEWIALRDGRSDPLAVFAVLDLAIRYARALDAPATNGKKRISKTS